ncbi:MAG: DUF2344 domain-containing protein [Elusimicrobia bacterium]|nr:DUF2344 domain-containing protein [Elusimicrobiota bacterium]
MRTISKVRVKYAKKHAIRFLSHLEVVSTLRKGIRRAGLPVCFSEGFSPQPRIAFGPPLAVGYTSSCEIFDMEMMRRVVPEETREAFLKSMPSSFEILSVKSVPVMSQSIESIVNVFKYSIKFPIRDKTLVLKKIQDFFNTEKFIVERLTDKSKREIDIRPLVMDLKTAEDGLEMLLRFGPKKTAKPDMIIQKIFNLNNDERLLLEINRDEFFYEAEGGELRKV